MCFQITRSHPKFGQMDHSVGKHIWVTQIHICLVHFNAKTKNMDRLKMYRFVVRRVFQSMSYLFSQFLRAGILCWKKDCAHSRHYSCLRELGKQGINTWKNFEHDTNLDNYSNRRFLKFFPQTEFIRSVCWDELWKRMKKHGS